MEQPQQPQIETFEWKGQVRYRCPLRWEGGNAPCQYDTADLEVLKQHMRMPHTHSGEPVKVSVETVEKPVETTPVKDEEISGLNFAKEE